MKKTVCVQVKEKVQEKMQDKVKMLDNFKDN